MCGRYITPESAAMERFWHIGRHNWLPFILPSFNIAPTTQVPIIVRNAAGEREVHAARWGLIPHWWKNATPPTLSFNARCEEAATKPMWRDPLKSRRCLMPMCGWYEWQVTPGSKHKQPWFVHVPGEEVLAFAGLWAQWKPQDGEPVLSCALLSKEAAPSIAPIHHRMPVVLKPEHFDAWLDPATPAAQVQAILADARTEFAAHPVSTRVNSARHNAPDLLDRLTQAS